MNPTPTKGLLASIVHTALQHRYLVLFLALILTAWGIFDLGKARYDVFPEFAPPQVVIQTESPGLAPEAVETLVTQPLENALNGIEGLASLRSSSIQGLSVITATFNAGSDIYRDRQIVAERLVNAASQLPMGVNPPAMTPLTSSTSTVLIVGLTSDQRSLLEMRSLADWTIQQRLLAVPGVAKVSIFGGDTREFQVQIDPAKLSRYGVSISNILDATRKATGVRGGGIIDNANQRLTLRSEGQAITTEDLAQTVIRRDKGSSLSLGDVARVIETAELPIGAASFKGKPAVQLMISEQYGANTVEVTQNVEAALKELTPLLTKQKIQLNPIFRPASFIETSTSNVTHALLYGSVLVVIVLFIFLANIRSAIISLTAIPLSLLTATLVLKNMGESLNTMTLGGLSIAIGLLVDDAVITVENIFRHLRENRNLEKPQSTLKTVLIATLEVRSAVVYATFAITLVFLPVLGLTGIAGSLFSPLAKSYLIATLASLVVALTVTPALSFLLLAKAKLNENETVFERFLKSSYSKLLGFVEKHFRWVTSSFVVLLLCTLITIPFLGSGFLPELKEGHFIVHLSTIPGTSIAESIRVGNRVTSELLKLPEVKYVAQRVGRAEAADDTWGSHYSEMDVELKPLTAEQSKRVQSSIHEKLSEFPGISFSIKPFLTERIEETLSGYTSPVAINIFGDNLNQNDASARKVAAILNQISGATDVQIQSPQGTPEMVVQLNRNALLNYGIPPTDALDTLNVGFEGNTVGQIYEGNKIVPVSVILSPEKRRSPENIKQLPLSSMSGEMIPFGNVASIHEQSGRYVVLHSGARRVQTVTANVTGRDVASFVKDAQQQLASKVQLPSGSYLTFSGTAEEQSRSTKVLLLQSLVAGVGLIMFLSLIMNSGRNVLLVLVNLPFALIGGILVVFVSDRVVTLGAMVGFITLFGITLRNSVMLLSRYEQLVRDGQSWNWQTVWQGAQERLMPILMTALVTALGLLPLALGSGEPGREIEGPMAIVILGGLLTSTVLNLLILPSLALRFAHFKTRAETEE